MKVKAIEDGYYNNKRVKAGKEFHVKNEKAFSKKWMKKVKKGDTPVQDDPPQDDDTDVDGEPKGENVSDQDVI